MKTHLWAAPFLAILASTALIANDYKGVDETLNAHWETAAKANWDAYAELFTSDAIYFGTDITERWDKKTLIKYAKGTSGWVYHLRERNISFMADGKIARFDEVLDSVNYGTSRGTGVLELTDTGWKIAQYHLTFPLPNDMTDRITAEIRQFESAAK
ncbi:MAG: nuclear transport factor 2 family protein [Kordiimonas sp.]